MNERAVFPKTYREWFQAVSRITTASWLVVSLYGVVYAFLLIFLYQLGRSNHSLTLLRDFLSYGFLVATVLAFWHGFAVINGYRPLQWRLIPKINYFSRQAASQLVPSGLLALCLVAYYLGSAELQSSLTELVGSVTVILLVVGLTYFAIGLGLLLKLLTKNYFVRAILFVLAIYFGTLGLQALSPLLTTLTNIINQPDTRQWLIILIAVGLLGLGVAVTELCSLQYRTHTQGERSYWRSRLSIKWLGCFGSGTLVFGQEFLYFLRHIATQRRIALAFVLGIIISATLRLIASFVSLNETAVFLDTTVLLISYIGFSLGFTAGEKLTDDILSFRRFYSKLGHLITAELAAVVVLSLGVSVVYCQLFAASWQFNFSSQLFAAMTGVITTVIAFQFGRISKAHHLISADPIISYSLGTIAIFATLLVTSFSVALYQVAGSLLAIAVAFLWMAVLYSLLEWNRSRIN